MKGMKLYLPLGVLLSLGMLLLGEGRELVLVTLVAALLHELGHVVAARLLNIPLRELRLSALGARLVLRKGLISYGEEWALCAAGPIFSLMGAAIAMLLRETLPSAELFATVSLFLGVLNLLPIRSFDGGRMADALLHRLLAERWADGILNASSFLWLFLLWASAVYLLLKAGEGISLLCFSMSLLCRFFEEWQS